MTSFCRAERLPLRLSERRSVDYTPPTEKKTNPIRQCVIFCSKRDRKRKKKRRKTRLYCRDCEDALCAVQCIDV
ncbi:hypothetical protein TNCV_316831 [Trichonephila clavipes]|nr:hypothetical protein TNCV_316831 [Trichonephila clavipes]